jgi:two-component system LytT family response regulator
MIRCIIIEDEPLAAKKLAGYVAKMDILKLQATFDNGADAISYLKSNQVDLIFLDICMEELDGMQVLNALTHSPKVIITSAESRYALDSYEHNVSDYLLKPFGFDRFIKAVSKVADELTKEQSAESTFIFLKTEYRTERIDLQDIQYIEGMKDYLSVVLNNKRIMTLMSFQAILTLLPPSRFLRVHKSYIVALDKIRSIERNRIRIGEELIPVSDTYKDQFLGLLKSRNHMI